MALRISLLSVRSGGAHSNATETLVEDYLHRCGRALPATARVLRTEVALLDVVREERQGGAAAFWIADLGGKILDTEQFAERIRNARDSGLRHLLLAIGPADGWSAEARAAAELRLSLSAMTMPHELARLLLAEQIYRAATILQGHPYHLGH
jgi:23S rRNA (pseudouridine1915-N3)-methyltransferase